MWRFRFRLLVLWEIDNNDDHGNDNDNDDDNVDDDGDDNDDEDDDDDNDDEDNNGSFNVIIALGQPTRNIYSSYAVDVIRSQQ